MRTENFDLEIQQYLHDYYQYCPSPAVTRLKMSYFELVL
jgi:hypothetical protein